MAKEGGIPDSYIVILKETSDQAAHVFWVKSLEERYKDSDVLCKLLCEYEAVKGYAATLTEAALEAVARSPDVDQIVQDTVVTEAGEVEGSGEVEAKVIQHDASWGLDRISTRYDWDRENDPEYLNYHYRVDPEEKRADVDVYVLDSGIYVDHDDFEGRASWGKTMDPSFKHQDKDVGGHGTHCAAIVAGRRWGACKEAKVIAVKVTEDGGGAARITALGIDWVITRVAGTKRPSVISASISSSEHPGLDTWAKKAVATGIHICAAAGNECQDASGYSPGRVPEVITVGATRTDDHKEPSSNFGSAVDIFAPGAHIYSAGIKSPSSKRWATGTSVAAPHVAGVVAYRLHRKGKQTPKEIRDWLIDESVENVLHHIGEDSPNRLLNNGA
ncbi:subtilisin-like serine protease [Ceratobasidium sp. 395]|nr:subtilisin-like serine protease [Ceratobasidium sp. 395]